MARKSVLRITKAQKQYSKAIGRLGGKTRAENLTTEQRRAIGLKASMAAAEARKRRAAARGRCENEGG